MKQKHGEIIQHFADRIGKVGHKLIIALCKSGIDSKMAELSAERWMHKSFVEPFKNILMNRKTNSFNDAVKNALIIELELEEDRVLDKWKRFNEDKCGKP